MTIDNTGVKISVGDKFVCTHLLRDGAHSFIAEIKAPGTNGYPKVLAGETGVITRVDLPKQEYHYQFSMSVKNEKGEVREVHLNKGNIENFFIRDTPNVTVLRANKR